MLSISKPTHFGNDGMAVRGQCNPDSPGWQLRWFQRDGEPTMVWQGAFKTCRHLQANCASASSLDEVRKQVADLLATDSISRLSNQPTDAYPSTRGGEDGQTLARRRRKRKRH